MAVDYKNNEHLNGLMIVLEDYTSWFHSLVKCIFYPEFASDLCFVNTPTSFVTWSNEACSEDGMPPEIIERLSNLNAELLLKSESLINSSKVDRVKPLKKDFDKFMTVYEEFLLYIRRLEKDILLDGIGYDIITGLRSKNMLESDVGRELERLSRQGKSFCIAMVKIDNFETINTGNEYDQSVGYIQLIAGLIKLSIRSFDDAYYLGGDEFILCLKQSDVTGGVSALERLRKELEIQEVKLNTELGHDKFLSMSCCIAEPVIGDNPLELIENLRYDLNCSDTVKTDTVLEYHELSPLQRYVQEDGKA